MRKRGWPAGLIERKGYYSWRHPHTRKEYGIGRDRAAAMREAIEANLSVAGESGQSRLVDRLSGADKRTLGSWMDRFMAELVERKLAANTIKSYRSLAKKLRAVLGDDTLIERIKTLQIADMLKAEQDAGKARLAQSLRSFSKDVFTRAVAAGWIDHNPALSTSAVKVKVQRARLTLEVVKLALDACTTPWLRHAITLGLVTGQRREDIARMRFADVRDGCLCVEQQKTGHRLMIPLELRLDALGVSLADAVKQCRSTGYLSKHLIHQTRRFGNSPVGSPIFKDTISKRFTELVDSLGMDWEGKESPTFHELRSLSKRLYTAQGGVDTKQLLGHTTDDSAALYADARGQWVRVGLNG